MGGPSRLLQPGISHPPEKFLPGDLGIVHHRRQYLFLVSALKGLTNGAAQPLRDCPASGQKKGAGQSQAAAALFVKRRLLKNHRFDCGAIHLCSQLVSFRHTGDLGHCVRRCRGTACAAGGIPIVSGGDSASPASGQKRQTHSQCHGASQNRPLFQHRNSSSFLASFSF